MKNCLNCALFTAMSNKNRIPYKSITVWFYALGAWFSRDLFGFSFLIFQFNFNFYVFDYSWAFVPLFLILMTVCALIWIFTNIFPFALSLNIHEYLCACFLIFISTYAFILNIHEQILYLFLSWFRKWC